MEKVKKSLEEGLVTALGLVYRSTIHSITQQSIKYTIDIAISVENMELVVGRRDIKMRQGR